jgi:hypothetical protein
MVEGIYAIGVWFWSELRRHGGLPHASLALDRFTGAKGVGYEFKLQF